MRSRTQRMTHVCARLFCLGAVNLSPQQRMLDSRPARMCVCVRVRVRVFFCLCVCVRGAGTL